MFEHQTEQPIRPFRYLNIGCHMIPKRRRMNDVTALAADIDAGRQGLFAGAVANAFGVTKEIMAATTLRSMNPRGRKAVGVLHFPYVAAVPRVDVEDVKSAS